MCTVPVIVIVIVYYDNNTLEVWFLPVASLEVALIRLLHYFFINNQLLWKTRFDSFIHSFIQSVQVVESLIINELREQQDDGTGSFFNKPTKTTKSIKELIKT
jgi:uncharacterized membrane protein